MGFGLETGFIEHLQNLTKNKYDPDLHTSNITVTSANIKSSQSSLAVV
jgi:hypothetical protein